MEDKEKIMTHYNKISNKSVNERKSCATINIKEHNNFIKSILFKKYIIPRDKILDFGIGKGGDFKKYEKMGVSEVYGLDIANRSLLDALARARAQAINFKIILKIKDCYGTRFDLKRYFDIISIQFSFHYSFMSEATLDTTLHNIAIHLHINGFVLISMPSKDEILRRRANNSLSNKFYKIEFHEKEIKGIYGIKYTYSLKDSIYDCVEYLVDIPELERKAKNFGLRIKELSSFDDFFDQNISINQDLYNKMKLRDLDADERAVTSLHQVLVFQKYD